MTTTVHTLKTDAVFYDAICDGRKTFDVRKMDRPFNAGDLICFVRGQVTKRDNYDGRGIEFTPDNPETTMHRQISYVLPHTAFAGIREGYGVLALVPLHEAAPPPPAPYQEAAPLSVSAIASDIWDKLAQLGFVPASEYIEQSADTRRDLELTVAKVFAIAGPTPAAGLLTTH